MLKMISKKSVLLFGVVLALCAFVLPSVASAASWSPVGTTDGRLDSADFGFSIPSVGYGASCGATTFSVTVDSAALATITGASFVNCNGDVGSAVGCTVTATGTGFPWRLTAVATTDIQIDGVDIDFAFVTKPGTLDECAITGVPPRMTGAKFTRGTYTGLTGDIHFRTMHGPVMHVPAVGTVSAVVRGSARATGLFKALD